MTKKISWYDLHNAPVADLKKIYKVTDRQIEQGLRRHMDGASSVERRSLYETVYSKKS